MNDYEIIDSHVHLYRDIAQEKQFFPIPGRPDSHRWRNPESVISYMDREGVSKFVVLNLLPNEGMIRFFEREIPSNISDEERETAEREVKEKLRAILREHNEWVCDLGEQNPRFVPGVCMQKLLTPEEIVEEVEIRVAQGAKTVKLLPGMHKFYPNDHYFWPMYEKCQELGVPVISDTGLHGPTTPEGVKYGQPINFTEVLESFPRLTLVMAHLASAFWDERVEMAQRYPNLFFDISGGFQAPDMRARDGNRAIAEEDAVRIIRKVGVERIMYGTDGPFPTSPLAIEQFLRLDLTEKEKRMILAENAKLIYKIMELQI